MQSKPFFTSKTLIGAALMLLGFICQRYQLNVPAADLATLGDQLTAAAANLSAIVGLALTVYGRLKAAGPLTLSAPKQG